MPTNGDEDPGVASTSVTTDDFKAFQESMQSSVAKEMQQMREMITRLFAKNGAPPATVEEPIPSEAEEASAKAKAEAEAKAAEEGLGLKKLVIPLNRMKARITKKPLLGIHPTLQSLNLILIIEVIHPSLLILLLLNGNT